MLKYLASTASYLLLSFLFVGITAAEEQTISGFALSEFNHLHYLLGKLATAERDPFFAAYLAADKLDEEALLLPYLLYSSNKHTMAGHKEKALDDLNLAY